MEDLGAEEGEAMIDYHLERMEGQPELKVGDPGTSQRYAHKSEVPASTQRRRRTKPRKRPKGVRFDGIDHPEITDLHKNYPPSRYVKLDP